MPENIYEIGLERNDANHVPLTPLSFLSRAAHVYPDRIAWKHTTAQGTRQATYREFHERIRQFASALSAQGITAGDTVSIMAPNIPAMLEAHYAVPMTGAVLNALNTRLDPANIAFILDHAETKILITDRSFSGPIREAIKLLKRNIIVIDVDDAPEEGGEFLGYIEYEDFLTRGDKSFQCTMPTSEWDAISLCYTSGTTGNPKGVVLHHRGAYLNSLGNALTWQLVDNPIYLWTLPMFHCNGWCFTWTITAQCGTHICLRKVNAKAIFNEINLKQVTHFCGAPIVLNMLINAPENDRLQLDHSVNVMTAAAPPPAAVIARMESDGFNVTHVYGLTEVYGPVTVCAWHDEWNDFSSERKAALKSRQGVAYVTLDGLSVFSQMTNSPVPCDGETIGEVVMRGNTVMKGYLKNETASQEAFAQGWFHTGDLGVMHKDGYIELKDRAKDIIISGGENISTIEIENVLFKHPAVLEAAVVARPDETWGETPCAFVTLKGHEKINAQDLISYCRENLAHFKAPKTIIFGDLPKTSTGKVQKFILRERAANLETAI